MIIAVAGPYSAPTEELRQHYLDAMNAAAARLLEMGHVPVIGMNAALPVLALANVADSYKGIMEISMAVISACDAVLLIAESPGANKERGMIAAQGKLVYYSLADIPAV